VIIAPAMLFPAAKCPLDQHGGSNDHAKSGALLEVLEPLTLRQRLADTVSGLSALYAVPSAVPGFGSSG